jgi:hypothetical protein
MILIRRGGKVMVKPGWNRTEASAIQAETRTFWTRLKWHILLWNLPDSHLPATNKHRRKQ